jgi:hypothetical protein
MTRLASVVLVIVIGATVTACTPVSIRTPAREPQACMDALMQGTLAKHAQTGLGIAEQDGVVLPVEWPFGYTARIEVSKIVLVDEKGFVVAREGDLMQVGGGMGAGPAPNAVWFACGPVTVTRPAS